MANKISGIYVIINTKNNKVYIGQSQNIKERWKAHLTQLRNGRHDNDHLQKSWNKYSEKAFQFRILEHCQIDQLDIREQHYLDIYIPKGICYNIAVDATSPMRGRKATKETTQKRISKIIGRHHTEESKKKIREAQLGQKRKPLSEEHKRKIGEASKRISQENRDKLRVAFTGANNPNFGKKLTEEQKQKLIAGVKRDDVRRKMSESAKKRAPISEETRARMCIAAKKRAELRKLKKENE